MDKILGLKCEPEKKQKIQIYLEEFLNCFLSFTPHGLDPVAADQPVT